MTETVTLLEMFACNDLVITLVIILLLVISDLKKSRPWGTFVFYFINVIEEAGLSIKSICVQNVYINIYISIDFKITHFQRLVTDAFIYSS